MGRVLWWFFRWLLGPSQSSGRRRPSGFRSRRPAPVRVVSVQDGDSLVVSFPGSRRKDRYRVRLYAIDAPEHDQRYGSEARDYLWRLVWGRDDLLLEPVDTDRYGRLVGVLYYRKAGRGRSVNRLMVQQGLAWWYSQYGGYGLGIEQAEREAKRRRRGLWASGGQVAPWDHRRAQRERAQGAGCLKWALFAVAVVAVVATIGVFWWYFR